MAITTNKAQLGPAGINAVFAMLTSYGNTKALPHSEDVVDITLDGKDLIITTASGTIHAPMNHDMLLDFHSIRANEASIIDRSAGYAPGLQDALLYNGTGFAPTPLADIVSNATLSTQGYYGLLTDFYFASGSSTETIVEESDVDTWMDVEFSTAAAGLFDNRPLAMKEAYPAGHSGTGVAGDPIVFSLEGLDTHAFANFRASMSFVPEIDEGQLETRLIFTRHQGATPNDQFPIEEVTISMEQGADIHYPAEPLLSFFVGDTIDTNGPGDAGSCKFQVKSSVEGVLHMRALTWYLNV